MSEIISKIEDGIPLPSPCAGKDAKYPVGKLQVGQSFLIELEPRTKKQLYQNHIGSYVHHIARRKGIKVAVRTVPHGLRVWRVE